MRHIYIKVLVLLFLCVGIVVNSKSQVKTKIFTEEIPPHFIPYSSTLVIPEKLITEPIELAKLLNRTQSKAEVTKEYSNRFAIPVEVDLNVLTTANATEENGITTFALIVIAKKALNISIQFNKFLLTEHSVLSIYTKNELTDSITASENNENSVWATRVYQGNKLTLVLKLPTKEKSNASLNINQVNFGLINLGATILANLGPLLHVILTYYAQKVTGGKMRGIL